MMTLSAVAGIAPGKIRQGIIHKRNRGEKRSDLILVGKRRPSYEMYPTRKKE
jgi:hypothetical protein